MSLFAVSLRKSCCFAVLCAIWLTACGCEVKSSGEASETPEAASSKVQDTPLSDFQNQLLDFAFEVASSIPDDPHLKDRCKMQEQAALACLKLDQPVKAIQMARQIDNWRKGTCFADLAFYCTGHDDAETSDQCLKEAEAVLTQIEEDMEEGEINWRRDRVKGKIQKVYSFKQYCRMNQADVDLSSGSEDYFDAQISRLAGLIATGGFEASKNALSSYVTLYGQQYDQSDRRTQIEERIKSSWGKIPYATRIELLCEMSEAALNHSESEQAVRFINEAQAFVDDFQWPTDKRIALMSDLIRFRFRCGDTEKAQADAESMSKLFAEEGKRIVDIDRADALRSLAEAYALMGNHASALSTYKQAVEEGLVNPNSRPRAEDLSATCCSMALAHVEPDQQLWERIHQAYEALGQPW